MNKQPLQPGRFSLWIGHILAILICAQSTSTVGADKSSDLDRPKIGVVLSGGGARGAAHVGVLRVLEEQRIPVDIITGTSMGSIVGGLYASGMSLDAIEHALETIDWDDAFQDDPDREDRSFRRKLEDEEFLVKAAPGIRDGKLRLPAGLIGGQKIGLILKSLTLPVADIDNFDDLVIPFRAVATDIANGKPVVIGSGDLATAMRASMSVPGAFAPVKKDGMLLVDGGVSNNLPVDVARAMGADIVIAVDISTPFAPREEIGNILTITLQLTAILTRSNTDQSRANLTARDILILPELGDISTMEFDRSPEAVPKGRLAAEEKIDALRRLSISDELYAKYQIRQGRSSPGSPKVVDFVRIDNQSRFSDKVITSRLHIAIGEPLDIDTLEDDIGKIYGIDRFELVSYDIVNDNDQTGVVVTAVEKSWGPKYLQGGLALQGDFSGQNSFNIAAAFTKTGLNPLAGEWRTIVQLGQEPRFFTELYQPLDATSRYFINPQLDLRKLNLNQFEGNDRVAEYRISTYGFGLEGGRELATWGELRTGWQWATGDAKLRVGDPSLPQGNFDISRVFLRLSWDTVDNRYFPSRGLFGNIQGTAYRKKLGSDTNFEQSEFSLYGAKSWGRHRILAGGLFQTTFGNDAAVESQFRLGGFFKLSGLDQFRLAGQHAGLLNLIYFRRMGDFNLLPTYIGASLEAGNTWNDRSDMSFDSLLASGSLFLGVDTFFGPFYMGYGYTEGGNDRAFLFLGQPF